MALEGEEHGQIETEVLYAEADGVHIKLQGEEKKRAESIRARKLLEKVEIAVRIRYASRNWVAATRNGR